ncbi:ShlB/FhaC/HecB family hemolysin secretion/activation protein, partial [Klebsiella pneumoniae]|uniref:ShlB/FhaC/HecB family hemolysin secretion/activation protein n=1 Tax=Klebsiella pneumoniae TaxID=573 RepID=UPI00272DDB04
CAGAGESVYQQGPRLGLEQPAVVDHAGRGDIEFNQHNDGNHNGSLYYSIPFGYWTLSAYGLGRSNSALLALALIGVWKFAGYYMLFFLAGLQS